MSTEGDPIKGAEGKPIALSQGAMRFPVSPTTPAAQFVETAGSEDFSCKPANATVDRTPPPPPVNPTNSNTAAPKK